MKQPLFFCYDKCNSGSVKDFYRQIMGNLAEPGKRAFIVQDNLSAHRSEVDVYKDELTHCSTLHTRAASTASRRCGRR